MSGRAVDMARHAEMALDLCNRTEAERRGGKDMVAAVVIVFLVYTGPGSVLYGQMGQKG